MRYIQTGISYLLLLLISTLIFPEYAIAQVGDEIGNLPIQYYSNREYKSLPQNFSIIQGRNKVMYFGNNNGSILEYDGVDWEQMDLVNLPIRSFAIDEKGLLYLGSEGEFGRLIPDNTGKWVYSPILVSGDDRHNEFGKVWKIISAREGIYFQTDFQTYLYTDTTLTKWNSQARVFYSFYLDGTYFVCRDSCGLAMLQKDSLLPVNDHPVFGNYIIGVLPYDNEVAMIATKRDGLFLWSNYIKVHGGKLTPFRTEADDLLGKYQISSCLRYSDKYYFIGTYGGGLIIIDRIGDFIQKIDRTTGLPDDRIEYQYLDDQKNLWLAMSRGISKVEVASPYTVFDDRCGINGSVQKITRFGGKLIAATDKGVFELTKQKLNNYGFHDLLPGNTMAAWDLLPFINGEDSVLLLALDMGVYEYTTEGDLNKIISCYPWVLHRSRKFPDLVVAGLDGNGITTLRRVSGRWEEQKKTGQEGVVRYISEDASGDLWMGTPDEGIIKIQTGSDPVDFRTERFDTTAGLPEGSCFSFMYDDTLRFATSKGVYGKDEKKNEFYPEIRFNSCFGDKTRHIHRTAVDNKGNIWMVIVTESPIKYDIGYFESTEKGLEWHSKEFNRISLDLIHTIFHEPDGVTWLGGDNGIFRYDLNMKNNLMESYHALTLKVIIGSDSVIFHGTYFNEEGEITIDQTPAFIPVIDFEFNSVIFEYSAQKNDKASEMLFGYYLEGEDQSWSDWTKKTSKEYTNLLEGKYIFKVKARDIYDNESMVAAYEFSIKPPWYRTYWAYAGYVILLVLFLFTGNRLNSRRLRAKNLRLETVIAERTAEIKEKTRELEKAFKQSSRQQVALHKAMIRIEEQKNEITDSIQYAKRIQKAVLPTEQFLAEVFPDSFVLFKPKDIVSGDFYWATTILSHGVTDGDGESHPVTKIMVVADCTGHGVPGAFMSMLGVSFLNEIINKEGIHKANLILNELRDYIIRSLRQKGISGESKDGMDVALCVIHQPEAGEDSTHVDFAGANNPLWIIKGSETSVAGSVDENLVTEVKGDKMPVAIYEKMQSFSNHRLDMNKGDKLYLFSDGFADQFGGPKGKKLKYKPFKRLIAENHLKSMQEQLEALDNAIEDWKAYTNKDTGKPFDQIDDIVVVGIKI